MDFKGSCGKLHFFKNHKVKLFFLKIDFKVQSSHLTSLQISVSKSNLYILATGNGNESSNHEELSLQWHCVSNSDFLAKPIAKHQARHNSTGLIMNIVILNVFITIHFIILLLASCVNTITTNIQKMKNQHSEASL